MGLTIGILLQSKGTSFFKSNTGPMFFLGITTLPPLSLQACNSPQVVTFIQNCLHINIPGPQAIFCYRCQVWLVNIMFIKYCKSMLVNLDMSIFITKIKK